MSDVQFVLTAEQVKALLQITQNQLFRLKFLDPKMPGYKPRLGELENVESSIRILEGALRIQRTIDGDWSGTMPRLTVPNVR
jgi:hypothetical protein